MVIWLTVLGVLGATLPMSAVVGIELSKLYGHHEYMEGRYKRSGELAVHTHSEINSLLQSSGGGRNDKELIDAI